MRRYAAGGTSTGASSTKTISIVAPSIDATAYQIDPAHDGAVAFASVSFPSSPTWRASLGGGTPSNIVIAAGKVFLTTGTAGGSQLRALDQGAGARAWGPKAIAGVPAGSGDAAYDNGRVFVSGSNGVSAYDAGTGAVAAAGALGSIVITYP